MLLQVSGLAVELKKRSRLRASPAAALRDQLQGLRAVETEWFNACEPLADSRCIGVGPAFCIHSGACADTADPNEDMHKRLKIRRFRWSALHPSRTNPARVPRSKFRSPSQRRGHENFRTAVLCLGKTGDGVGDKRTTAAPSNCQVSDMCECIAQLYSSDAYLHCLAHGAWRLASGTHGHAAP